MPINIEVKRKITVDGKEYDNLAQVPSEARAAIVKALASQPVSKTQADFKFNINGKTYSSVDDLPSPLRFIVAGLTALALKRIPAATTPAPDTETPTGPAPELAPTEEAVRPDPVLSVKSIVVGIGLIVLLTWLVRLVL